MKYVPKLPSNNVNVTYKSPFYEFLLLLGSVLTILFVAYLLLGFALDFTINRYEEQVSTHLAALFSKTIHSSPQHKKERKACQRILDRLLVKLPEPKEHYEVQIKKSPASNALAYPGNHIVVFSGLVEQVASENELAMVLAHELGHFVHKDHLRRLGRGLVLFTLSSLFLGQDSYLTSLLGGGLDASQSNYSREQEEQADLFALNLLYQTYGHVGGSLAFFEKIDKQENPILARLIFTSHPLSETRIENINRWIKEKKYPIKQTIPFLETQ